MRSSSPAPDRSALAEDLRAGAFGVGAPPRGRWIGAECEMLALAAADRLPVPIEEPGGLGTLPVLRRLAARRGWREEPSASGAPIFRVRGGGFLSYEPGGQIELSSARMPSVPTLVRALRAVLDPLREAMGEAGIDLLSAGIDPWNPIERAPPQLLAPRYLRMAAHFDRIGPAGARMMRQTASLQVSVDWEGEGPTRWRTLNACAPLLTAIFASSRVYSGVDTGAASFRARTWRELDPARTGLPTGADAAEAYLELALGADAILRPGAAGETRSMGEWVRRGECSWEEWRVHLTTLFPEVRPRGFAEIRSIDAVAPEWLAVPPTLLAGVVYDAAARREAEGLLGEPDPVLLVRAGEAGLADPEVGRLARDLFRIAMAGAARLGPPFVDGGSLEVAAEYFARYTRAGRAPGDELALLPLRARHSA